MLRVTVEIEGKTMGIHNLHEGANVIGRSRSSDIKVEAPDISRAHVKLTVSGGKVMAENLSQFGTKVGDVAITTPTEAKPGQRIVLGGMTTLILQEVADSDPTAGTEVAPLRDAGGATRAGMESEEATVVARGGEDLGAVARAAASRGPGRTRADATGEDGDARDKTDDDGARRRGAPAAGKTQAEAGPEDAVHETAAAAAPGGAGSTRGSMSFTGSDEGHTRVMQTQMVSPEELGALRAIEQKRMKNRITLALAIGIPVLILAIVLRPKPLPPEDELDWNKDAAGEYLEALEAAPSGAKKDGGFDLIFPGGQNFERSTIPGGMQIDTRVGRDRNVPFRLTLEEESDKRFVEMSRDAVVNEWMTNRTWNFDRPLPTLAFYGKDQGIPYVRVPYQREGDGSWFGVACIFRHGQKRFVFKAEVPDKERPRAERLVFKQFVDPSRAFVRSHWEGTGETPKAPEGDIVREARLEMSRMAPATWAKIETLLKGALAKSVITGNTDVQAEAMDLLQELRRRQTHWFNSQEFARDSALAEGDKEKAVRIAEFTKGVFSNQEDSRYYWVRKW